MNRPTAQRSNTWPLLLACSALSGGCFATDPVAEYAAPCSLYANNTCLALARCGSMLIESTYGTMDACQLSLAGNCQQNVLLPDAYASTVGVEACAAQMQLVECPAILNRELPAACQPPQGRRQSGARCRAGGQCASARCAKPTPGALEGSCQELAALGGACSTSDDCLLGLVCGAQATCAQLGRPGDACSEALPCRVPLTCLRDRCQDLQQPSAECDALHPCSPDDVDRLDELGACRTYATTVCGRLSSCSARFVETVYGDAASCSERLTASCVAGLRAPDFTSSTIGLNACTQVTQNLECAALFDNLPPEECRIGPGPRPDGQPCGSDAQCASTRCAIAPDAPCGTCAPLGQPQQPCRVTSDCVAGLLCSSASVCQAPAVLSAFCDAAHPCSYGSICAAGRCAMPVGLGQACDPTADPCDRYAGLYCDAASTRCKAWLPVAAGQACGVTSAGLAVCSAGSSCQLIGSSALCQPAIADGEACTPGAAVSCRAAARCIAGRCQIPAPETCP